VPDRSIGTSPSGVHRLIVDLLHVPVGDPPGRPVRFGGGGPVS
jgi:hypothetical protein